jgi:hypothetical protein
MSHDHTQLKSRIPYAFVIYVNVEFNLGDMGLRVLLEEPPAS